MNETNGVRVDTKLRWTAWGAASLPPIFTFMASLFIIVIAGMSHAMRALQEAGAGFSVVLLCTMFAVVVCSALLFLAARGKAVPSAVTLFAAFLPWLAGVGASRWGASRVAEVLAYVEPRMRPMLAARGMAEATIALSYGALLSGALFAAVALGFALGAFGQRAPERKGPLGLFGVMALPLTALVLYVAPSMRVGGWLLALPALLAFPALGLAGASLGRGEDAGRAAGLSAAVPMALALSLLATATSLAQRDLQLTLAGLPAVDTATRAIFGFRAVTDMGSLTLTGLYASLLSVLAALSLATLGAMRTSVTPGRIAGAAAATLALLMGYGLPSLPAPELGLSAQPIWGSTTQGPPLSTQAGAVTGASPSIWLTSEGLQTQGTLPPHSSAEGMRVVLDPLRSEDGSENCGHIGYDPPRVGLDAEIPAAILRSFVEASTQAELQSLTLVAQAVPEAEPNVDRAAIQRLSPLLALIVQTPYRQTRVLVAAPALAACLDAREERWTVDVGAAPADILRSPTGATRPLAAGTVADQPDAWAARKLVELRVTSSSTSAALFETAARVEAAGMWAVLAPAPHVTAAGFGGLGLHHVQRLSQAQQGSLPREVIRRVIRRHITEVRFCYEQQLNRNPELEGRVTIRFIIGATGEVRESMVQATTLGNQAVEDCIVGAARRWVFPAPDDGGIVIVNYPFMLTSSEEAGAE